MKHISENFIIDGYNNRTILRDTIKEKVLSQSHYSPLRDVMLEAKFLSEKPRRASGDGGEDYYFINKDGSVNIIRTNDNVDHFYVENRQGNGYIHVASLKKNSSGLVQFPASDGLFNRNFSRCTQIDKGGYSSSAREYIGEGDHYLEPQTAASLFGLVNELNENGISPSFGDMSSSNGSDPWQPGSSHHAGHGHHGTRTGLDIDFEYINNDGNSFQDADAFNATEFSQSNNQTLFSLAKKYGFTKNFQGKHGTLNGPAKIDKHNNHGHLGYNTSAIKTTIWNREVLNLPALPFSPPKSH